ncbi:MAG TPA: thioredoxin family protein [Chthonomonadaceae bacterium]|nr:thioredoxin family protein [Chthonomonadaceae bacterium]
MVDKIALLKKLTLTTLTAGTLATALPMTLPTAAAPGPDVRQTQEQIAWHTDLSAALRDARSTGKPILLVFEASWCPYSRRMERETFADSTVIALSRDFHCVKVDGDTDYGKALMRQYSVDAFPTTLLLDSSGSVQARMRGLQTADALAQQMRAVAPARIAWQSSLSDAMDESRRTGKPILLVFHADWCPFCRRMERETFADPTVARLSRNFICVKVDTETAYGKQLCEEYAVDAYPYVIFFSDPNTIVKTIEGFQSPDAFVESMRKVL